MGIMLPPFELPVTRPPVTIDTSYVSGATFTVTLGCLIENNFDLDMNHYPIFDENYRKPLNDKIIEHFWFREIGLETPQLFKRFLNRRMNEIMPLYNQLYRTQLSLDNMDEYTANVDLKTERNTNASSVRDESAVKDDSAKTTSKGTNATESQASSRALVSNTPQMQLSGNEDYASNITDTRSDSKSDNKTSADSDTSSHSTAIDSTSAKTTEDYVSHILGVQGITKANAIMQVRQTILNIDMLVIDDLRDLFMDVYNDYANFL